jgi:predicted choloylglycine hydrolase
MTSLETQRDVQLPPIFIQGDARQIGVALGRHTGEVLRSVIGQSREGVYERWRGTSRVEGLRQSAYTAFPDAYAELEGIAEGAELPFEDIFLFNCIADLPTLRPVPDSGCTTFLLPANPIEGQPAIIAHNEDACLVATTPWFIANICRAGRAAFTSLCYGGKLPGTAFSVNSHGLVQTINDVRPRSCQVGAPRAFLARTIVECRNLDSALDLIRRTTRASGYHHSLGSMATGEIYSVEAPSFGEAIVRVDHPQVHANHIIRAPLKSVAQYVVGSSHSRQKFGEELLNVSRINPLAALRASDQCGQTIAQSPTADNDWHKTIVSAIFEIESGAIRWAAYGTSGQQVQSGSISASKAQTIDVDGGI